MAVIRIVKDKNFITMGKYHLKEKDMSLKAIGLLSIMLSLPENWNYSVNGLSSIRKESRNTINEILKELEKFGYLNRIRIRDEKGKIVEVEYTIYECPYLKNQDMDNQDMENRDIDFKAQLNNKELNNKLIEKLNNKEIYKEIVEYLNLKANTNYKDKSSKTQSLIQARLNEGFTKNDFKIVIDNKCSSWLDNEMSKYLRPETLFGTKFESYLNEKPTKRKETEQEWEERMEREIKEMEESERKRN